MADPKSAKEILKEMGFNPDSKESTQFALYRHLKRAAQELERISSSLEPLEPVQLEFDLDGPTSGLPSVPSKKISNR